MLMYLLYPLITSSLLLCPSLSLPPFPCDCVIYLSWFPPGLRSMKPLLWSPVCSLRLSMRYGSACRKTVPIAEETVCGALRHNQQMVCAFYLWFKIKSLLASSLTHFFSLLLCSVSPTSFSLPHFVFCCDTTNPVVRTSKSSSWADGRRDESSVHHRNL